MDYLKIEVHDRQSFSDFVGLLLKDFKNRGEEWENNRLDLFLGAMQAYAEDIQGYYKNNHLDIDANKPTWRTFADIMRGAVVYE